VGPQRDLFLPTIAVDRTSPTPLHEQIRAQFVRALRSGAHAGQSLPSTRLLARLLGVSRNTVLGVYDDLAADGLIQGRPGAGMVVADTAKHIGSAFDPRRVMRHAQYPARTIALTDPDGTPLYLSY
jgi:DNA-binding transcriptional regulator YhcF (GntR family)